MNANNGAAQMKQTHEIVENNKPGKLAYTVRQVALVDGDFINVSTGRRTGFSLTNGELFYKGSRAWSTLREL